MIIAVAKKKMTSGDAGLQAADDHVHPHVDGQNSKAVVSDDDRDVGEYSDREAGVDKDEAANGLAANLTGGQKRLFELRLKMKEARKANQTAIVAEKKKSEAPTGSRGISKQKWLDERKKKIGKLLDSNGLDMSEAYMLDTQVMAEAMYKKWEKDPPPAGWDVFNQRTLYNAYKKRTKNIDEDLDEYSRMKEADPEFYREASSLQYAPKISEERIDRMVKELKEGKRSYVPSAGGESSGKKMISTQLMTEMSTSIKRLIEPLANTHWRSRTTLKEEQFCRLRCYYYYVIEITYCTLFLEAYVYFQSQSMHFLCSSCISKPGLRCTQFSLLDMNMCLWAPEETNWTLMHAHSYLKGR